MTALSTLRRTCDEGFLFAFQGLEGKAGAMSFEIILAGVFVGVLIGLTGMGGGSLITPMMIFVFGVPPQLAVGTDLVLSAFTKAAGAFTHLRLGNTDFAMTKTLLRGSIPGAVLGIVLMRLISAWHIVEVDELIKRLLGLVLLAVSASLLFRSLWKRVDAFRLRTPGPDRSRLISGVSFGVGVIVSLTSVGSGSLLVPFLLASTALPLSRVVGVDLMHGAVLAAVAGAGHVAGGNVDIRLLANLLIGSVPGAILGGRLSLLFPKRGLELVLASMLAISAVKLL